jgi:hypothetical protein
MAADMLRATRWAPFSACSAPKESIAEVVMFECHVMTATLSKSSSYAFMVAVSDLYHR